MQSLLKFLLRVMLKRVNGLKDVVGFKVRTVMPTDTVASSTLLKDKANFAVTPVALVHDQSTSSSIGLRTVWVAFLWNVVLLQLAVCSIANCKKLFLYILYNYIVFTLFTVNGVMLFPNQTKQNKTKTNINNKK